MFSISGGLLGGKALGFRTTFHILFTYKIYWCSTMVFYSNRDIIMEEKKNTQIAF